MVTPKVVVGDRYTGIGTDSWDTAYSKYNVHQHNLATSLNPLILGIKLNSEITKASECDLNLFPEDTFVESITESSILVSNPAIRSSSSAALKFDDKLFNNLVVTQGSQTITTETNSGFLSGEDLYYLRSKDYSSTVTLSTSQVLHIVATSKYSGLLEQAVVSCSEGTLASIEILITRLDNSIDSLHVFSDVGASIQTQSFSLSYLDSVLPQINVGETISLNVVVDGNTDNYVFNYHLYFIKN